MTTGGDGYDLLKLCVEQGESFDVILLDENMQRMNGSTAATILRGREAKNGKTRIPIIMTTANTCPHDIAKYFAVGVDGIVCKPINMRALGESLLCYFKFKADAAGAATIKVAAISMAHADPAAHTLVGSTTKESTEFDRSKNVHFKDCVMFGDLQIFLKK